MAIPTHEIKQEQLSESVCRLCFTECEHYRCIFEDEYSSLLEWTENLLSMKIEGIPNAPALLCLECESTLKNFDSFREMCYTNDRVIKGIVAKDDSRTDDADISKDVDSTLDCQVDNADITIDYQSIKTEAISSHSEDDGEKTVTSKNKRHMCGTCDKSYKSEIRFKIHIQSHTQERSHKCEECNKSFTTQGSLNVHKRIHTGVKPFVCDRCPAKFTQSANLVRHNQMHLRRDLSDILKSADENDSSQDTNKFLLERMKGKGRNRKHCTICDKYVTNLSDHKIIHLDTRPFQCTYCPKAFNQIHKLKIHIRTHTNEKPYLCSFCSKAFTNKQDMKIHIRSHTQERPFKCKDCKKAFITIGHLNQHKKVHSGVKPFSCDRCERKFSQKVHLIRHKQVRHKNSSDSTHVTI